LSSLFSLFNVWGFFVGTVLNRIVYVSVCFFIFIGQSSYAGPKDYDPVVGSYREVLNGIIQKQTDPDIVHIMSLADLNNPEITISALKRISFELSRSAPNDELISELLRLLIHYVQAPEGIFYKNRPLQYDIDPFIQNMQYIQLLMEKADSQYRGNYRYEAHIRPLFEVLTNYVEKAASRNLSGNSLLRPFDISIHSDEEIKEAIRLASQPHDPTHGSNITDENFVPLEEKIKVFRKRLQDSIMEQDEVIDIFTKWEAETLVKGFGNSNDQKITYLAGLPGTGKDTSAEALVRAYYADSVAPGEEINVSEHLFMVGTQRTAADAWALLGSATGYVGSDKMSPLIRFLVKHSGGKYKLETSKSFNGNEVQEAVLNPEWKPGQVLEGYYPPEKAIIFLNEFHHWSQDAKDILLKHALEKGIFKINNPGKHKDAVSEIQLYGLRIIIASNELTDLMTNRNPDGTRFGRKLSYDDMLKRWQAKSQDKSLLKEAIAKTVTQNARGTPNDQKIGISEAVLSRIPSWCIVLMKPLSPDALKKIAKMKIRTISRQFSKAAQGAFGQFNVEASDELIQFIQEYDFEAEEGGRAIQDKVKDLVEHPLLQMLQEGIKPSDLKNGVLLTVESNPDKTSSLVMKSSDSSQVIRTRLMETTLKERENQPISDKKIIELSGLEERLNHQVFGAKKAAKKIADAMLIAESNRYVKRKKWEDHLSAVSFGFFGPSSTGKSEMAKALVREIYPEYGEERRVDIDFNKIQTPQAMEEFIWGRKFGNEVHPSEFMKKYDQYNGDILFVFEETSNTPKELLRSLYDLFRENHPKFADGVDRPMTNVTIIMTGNAGIKWYSQVPKDVPIRVQLAAWKRIHEQSMRDPSFLRQTLEEYYPEPLINRIGQSNIIWFAPLDFKAIRELSYLKLTQVLKGLKPTDGGRGWDIGFRSEEDLQKTIQIIEREGFILYEQGASIDRYVRDNFGNKLKALLLKNQIPSGKKVVIVPRADQTEEVIQSSERIFFDVLVENASQLLQLEAEVQKRTPEPKQDPNDQILTAAHEAGHEIVGKALLGDKFESDFISIIPGVTKIQDQWIYYAGIASKEEIEKLSLNYEAGIYMIAQLMAGFEGERAVSIGARHSTGKSNDTDRATQIAENMIVRWGLVSEWGFASIDPAKMSEARMRLKEKLIHRLLTEGQELAQKILFLNRDLHFEMTRRLARKGEIGKSGLRELYKEIAIRDNKSLIGLTHIPKENLQGDKSHRVELRPEISLKPDELADISKVVELEYEQKAARAEISSKPPIFQWGVKDNFFKDSASRKSTYIPKSCEALFAL